MEQTGITHILSLGIRPQETPDTAIDMKFLEVEDNSSGDMLSLFPQAVEFISQALISGGKILVHCFMGVSRSASCVIAYIMAT